jgi:hypothetical protein
MRRVVKYDAVDKNIPGPKLVKEKNISLKAAEKEWEKVNAPSAATYLIDQKDIGSEAPQFTFGKDKRERTPSPDFKRSINPNFDVIR